METATGHLRWAKPINSYGPDRFVARLTASPVIYQGQAYQGVSRSVTGFALDPTYPCCTFRGSMVALDATTGQNCGDTTPCRNPLIKQIRPLDSASASWIARTTAPGSPGPGPGATETIPPPSKPVLPGIVQLSWLMFLPPSRLNEEQQTQLSSVLSRSPTLKQAYPLIQTLAGLIRQREAAGLAEWLNAVEQSEIAELVSLGRGIRRDEAAVRAGLSEPWSQGIVEGKVNKLKLIKRKLYGRTGFELLRAMVLAAED